MLSAINVPKSKSITIAFVALKAMALGMVVTLKFKQAGNKCDSNVIHLSDLTWVFFLLGVLLDFLSLVYFLLTKNFSRLEYYVFFGFHIIICGLSMILGLVLSKGIEQECSVGFTFVGTVLCINFVLLISAFIIMMFNLYFVLKYAHFGCNVVWTYMWLAGNECNHLIVSVIGIIHGLLAVAGLVSFVVMNLMKKTTLTSKCWKQFYVISIFMMIFCYILIWIAASTDQSCASSQLFIRSYQIFGLLELLSPLLLLIFLNTELGDPRDMVLKKDAQVFVRGRENQNFVVNDVD